MKPKEIYELLELLWQGLAGWMPDWLLVSGKAVLGILVFIWLVLFIIAGIRKLWMELLGPILYDDDEKRRAQRRRNFADHIEMALRKLNTDEVWSDNRYAELEAEVETHGRRRSFWMPPPLDRIFQNRSTSLRHEKSLSDGLRRSQERRILLEGDPGAGKSVALRHLGLKLAKKAMDKRSSKSRVPLYVNLKSLRRKRKQPIDRALIESFVKVSVNRVNDRDVDEFLEEEFERGVQEGTWIFLFDSFDEIPDVLTAVEADSVIREYANAIDDFLSGMNQCRGIIASRRFRGPKQMAWTRFRILPLKQKRTSLLIRRFGLKPADEKKLHAALAQAPGDIQAMVANPMFLGLICERAKNSLAFPSNAHTVMGSYIENRLDRDRDRLESRYSIQSNSLEKAAEEIAFAMTSTPGLGLSPDREALFEAMAQSGLGSSRKHTSKVLDALEYIKLARAEAQLDSDDISTFTFAHRRFQEYFATKFLIQHPERASPHDLLTNGLWRETAVVLCQTQSEETLRPVMDEALCILRQAEATVAEDPAQEIPEDPGEAWSQTEFLLEGGFEKGFQWPEGFLHLGYLLRDGFRDRPQSLSLEHRRSAAQGLRSAFRRGRQVDKKWALEISSIMPRPNTESLLRWVLASQSFLFKEIAFWQVSQLRDISDRVLQQMRAIIVRMGVEGRLNERKHELQALIGSLENEKSLAVTLSVSRWLCLAVFPIFWILFLLNLGHLLLLSKGLISIAFLTLLAGLGYNFLIVQGRFIRRWRPNPSRLADALLALSLMGQLIGILSIFFPLESPLSSSIGISVILASSLLVWLPALMSAVFGQLIIGVEKISATSLAPFYPYLYLIERFRSMAFRDIAVWFIANMVATSIVAGTFHFLKPLVEMLKHALHIAEAFALSPIYQTTSIQLLVTILALLLIGLLIERTLLRKKIERFLESNWASEPIQLLQFLTSIPTRSQAQLLDLSFKASLNSKEWLPVLSDFDLAVRWNSAQGLQDSNQPAKSEEPEADSSPQETSLESVQPELEPPFQSEAFKRWWKDQENRLHLSAFSEMILDRFVQLHEQLLLSEQETR